jgi:hypothetical protein
MSHMKHTAATTLIEGLVERLGACLTLDAAKQVLSLKIDPRTQRRLDVLAEKSTEGELSPQEHTEYASLVIGLDLVTLIQARARAVLADSREAR